MKIRSFSTALVFALGVLAAVPAHAGLFSWLDDVTTYNEDQKRPLNRNVAPPAPPAYMYYDAEEATEWSRHYTRGDLEPTPYMEGSASRVMRVRQDGADTFGRLGPTTVVPDGGYEAMLRRDYINRMMNARKGVYIGEAGQGPDAMAMEPGELGRKTMVDDPRRNWRESVPGGLDIRSRPGDFDYQDSSRMAQAPLCRDGSACEKGRCANGDACGQSASGGIEIARSPGMGGGTAADRYTVGHGDTLSGISDQERIYGDWKLWPLIYDANRDQVKDPDLIRPGQDLGIPRDYTDDTARDARRRATTKVPPHLYTDGQ